MIRDQQLQKRTPHVLHILSAGLHLHSRFNQTNAGGGINSLTNVHDAHATNADRLFILLMAKSGNGDAAFLSSFEDRGFFALLALDDHGLAVDRKPDLLLGNKCRRKILVSCSMINCGLESTHPLGSAAHSSGLQWFSGNAL